MSLLKEEWKLVLITLLIMITKTKLGRYEVICYNTFGKCLELQSESIFLPKSFPTL